MTKIANKKFSGNEDSRVDVVRPRDFAPKKFGKNLNLRKKIIDKSKQIIEIFSKII